MVRHLCHLLLAELDLVFALLQLCLQALNGVFVPLEVRCLRCRHVVVTSTITAWVGGRLVLFLAGLRHREVIVRRDRVLVALHQVALVESFTCLLLVVCTTMMLARVQRWAQMRRLEQDEVVIRTI